MTTTDYQGKGLSWPSPGSVALHENELWTCGAGGAAADRSQGYHSDLVKITDCKNNPFLK